MKEPSSERNMPIRTRQQHLLKHINTVGIASVQELSSQYGVSEMTIRRDIEHLARSKLLTKVKGGAQRLNEPVRFCEAHLCTRMKLNTAAKQRLADKAAALIEPGDTLFLDGSTTIICLAQILARSDTELTVVTNSILVALELAEARNVRVICPGGVLDHETFCLCQMDDDSVFLDYHAKKAFLSCTGLIVTAGTYENSLFNMPVKRRMAKNAETVYVIVDGSKLRQRALNRVLSIDEIDVLVTEEVLTKEETKFLADRNIEICLVGE